MKVVVFGGRHFNDWQLLCQSLTRIHEDLWPVTILVHGCARGADSLADQWAKTRGIPRERIPADWDAYGDAAGAIRNQRMITQGMPQAGVAFPGGSGTADMLQRCFDAGLEVVQVAADGQWWVSRAPERAKQAVFMF